MDHFFIEIAHYKHYATDKSSLVTGTLQCLYTTRANWLKQ